MKKMTVPLATGEIQIKTTVRHYFTLSGMAINEKTDKYC
jgi:hypothetical protein